MNLNEFIFREYDIRGKVSDDFPEELRKYFNHCNDEGCLDGNCWLCGH